jgi:hypothetical protein
MQPQHEQSVRGILNPKVAENVTVKGTSIRDVVRKILGEEFEKLKKVRLTWKADSLEPPSDPSLQIGKLRKDGRPYIGPIGDGRYYIQNGIVLRSNGEEVEDLSTISEHKPVEQRRDGRIVTYKSDREMVDEALASYMRVALSLDPNLCPYCARVSARTRQDYMRHVYSKHPKEFVEEMEQGETRADVMADAHGTERMPPPVVEEPHRVGRPPKNDVA